MFINNLQDFTLQHLTLHLYLTQQNKQGEIYTQLDRYLTSIYDSDSGVFIISISPAKNN